MPHFTAQHPYGEPAELHYEDSGSGRPVVLIHGYPLDSRLWAPQVPALTAAGCRTITYDCRGFGRSARSAACIDFDTFAADLDALLTGLGLTDVALVGHGMGTGEIVRYLGMHGSDRISRTVLLAPLPPCVLHSEENPEGLDLTAFDTYIARARQDHVDFLDRFVDTAFATAPRTGTATPEPNPAPPPAVAAWRRLAAELPPRTCAAAIPTWITDFRPDLAAVDVPTLIVHGDHDQILPVQATSGLLRELLPHAEYAAVEGAPHALIWTHTDEVNQLLTDFLAE